MFNEGIYIEEMFLSDKPIAALQLFYNKNYV